MQGLNRDLLEDIVARLDGSTLASAACACSEIKDIAQDQRLWKQLCHSTWPSTAQEQGGSRLFASKIEGFDKFYADSYPLIFHGKDANSISADTEAHLSPSNIASFIDVYCRKKCISSWVMDGIPNAEDTSQENENQSDLQKWFLNCPFTLDLFHAHDGEDNSETSGPTSKEIADIEESIDHCKYLQESIRLSWILLDKNSGKAVNLSSWKPLFVKKWWPSEGEYVMQFGSVVPVEETVLPDKSARCLILVKCRMINKQGSLRWTEVSLRFEDSRGARLNGTQSLKIMHHALYCSRTANHLEVEKANHLFERQKEDIVRKRKHKDRIADWLCVLIEVAIFTTLCYYAEASI